MENDDRERQGDGMRLSRPLSELNRVAYVHAARVNAERLLDALVVADHDFGLRDPADCRAEATRHARCLIDYTLLADIKGFDAPHYLGVIARHAAAKSVLPEALDLIRRLTDVTPVDDGRELPRAMGAGAAGVAA